MPTWVYFVLGFILLNVVGTVLIRFRLHRIAASRPGEDFGSFCSSFRANEAPPDVRRAVYTVFQKWGVCGVAEFPVRAVEYCLREGGIAPEQLDYVSFYDKPLLKFDRLLETYLAYAPSGFRSFLQAMPVWLRKKLYLTRELNQGLGKRYTKRYIFTEHHESHAASAFFPSPFEEAAILTLDGVGEWAIASYGTGRGNKIHLTHELRTGFRFPRSRVEHRSQPNMISHEPMPRSFRAVFSVSARSWKVTPPANGSSSDVMSSNSAVTSTWAASSHPAWMSE